MDKPAKAVPTCEQCGKTFARPSNLKQHRLRACRGSKRAGSPLRQVLHVKQIRHAGGIVETESAFNHFLSTFDIPNDTEAKDAAEYLESKKPDLTNILGDQLDIKGAIKVNLVFECEFCNLMEEQKTFNFKTKNIPIYVATDKDLFINDAYAKLLMEMEEFAAKKSGWSLCQVTRLQLKVSKYRPFRGSSYIKLPDVIADKKAVINPFNPDDLECFKWAMLAPYVEEKPQRLSKLRPLEKIYEWKDITFPPSFRDIRKFEKRNNVSVNVFGLDENLTVYPLKVCDHEMVVHRDLLLVHNDLTSHYCFITDLNKLVHSQITTDCERLFVCKRCFTHYPTIDRLSAHSIDCQIHKPAKIIMPQLTEDNKAPFIMFRYHERKLPVPFVIYADLEASLAKILHCMNDPKRSSTTKYQRHKAMSFGAIVISTLSDGEINGEVDMSYKSYRGLDAAAEFMKWIHDRTMEIQDVYWRQRPMLPLTRSQKVSYKYAKRCYLCEKPFEKKARLKQRDHCHRTGEFHGAAHQGCTFPYENPHSIQELTEDEENDYTNSSLCYVCGDTFGNEAKIKVRDHSHLTGQFRGPAHQDCNLKCKSPSFIPIFFHNLSGYDAHFIVRELGNTKESLEVIPNSEEKFVTFSKRVLTREREEENEFQPAIQAAYMKNRFVDSYRFMSSSLEQLIRNLPRDRFTNMEKHFPAHLVDLLIRKGVFCYDYIDNIDKLKETRLPSKADFSNKLTESEVSDEDFAHAQAVWEAFDCQTLGEYMELYLKCDVLLLADVFEKFRELCLSVYKLDPAWYFTAPGLAFDACLRHSRVKLDLITDYDMLLMFEKGTRGGLAQCCKRHCVASNPSTGQPQGRKFIVYDDANNLYGWAMSKNLPTGGFEWVDPDNVPPLESIDENAKKGYVLEVDVEYPRELHDEHRDLPFLPEHRVPPGSKYPKLLTTLFHKEKYVVHYVNLQQAIKAGLRVTKIHRAIRFDQSPWLEAYIALNTAMRQRALTAFEKEFFKLMNNAVFGKTMENVRKRTNIQLINDAGKLRKLIAKPNFLHHTIYNENLAAIHMGKVSITMNKPIYVGMCILDLSKTLMYDFFYNVLKPRYKEDMELLYMDTDSYVIDITTDDVYDDVIDMHMHFDTSNFKADHKCYSEENKMKLGCFKDEAKRMMIIEYVGLKAKAYALKINHVEIERSKGLYKYAVQNKLSFEDYKTCLST